MFAVRGWPRTRGRAVSNRRSSSMAVAEGGGWRLCGVVQSWGCGSGMERRGVGPDGVVRGQAPPADEISGVRGRAPRRQWCRRSQGAAESGGRRPPRRECDGDTDLWVYVCRATWYGTHIRGEGEGRTGATSGRSPSAAAGTARDRTTRGRRRGRGATAAATAGRTAQAEDGAGARKGGNGAAAAVRAGRAGTGAGAPAGIDAGAGRGAGGAGGAALPSSPRRTGLRSRLPEWGSARGHQLPARRAEDLPGRRPARRHQRRAAARIANRGAAGAGRRHQPSG